MILLQMVIQPISNICFYNIVCFNTKLTVTPYLKSAYIPIFVQEKFAFAILFSKLLYYPKNMKKMK